MTRIILATVVLFVCLGTGCTETAPDGDRSVQLGLDAYRRGEYLQAVEHFEAAIEGGVQSYRLAEVYTYVGNCYNELEQCEAAIRWHKRALEEEPDFHNAWSNLGVVHRFAGDFDEAESCYQKALEIAPDYAEGHANLGALYIFRDEPDKAIASLEKALDLDDSLPVVHSNLALAYALAGRFEEAAKELRRAVVLGYPNADVIQQRINDLKSLEPDP